jgi:hypothetical protein
MLLKAFALARWVIVCMSPSGSCGATSCTARRSSLAIVAASLVEWVERTP